MKLILAILTLSIVSQNSFAAGVPVKNEEFARAAKAAAKAIYDLNWGPSAEQDYEIGKETLEEDDTHISGSYEVITTKEEDGERTPRGITLHTTVIDGAVLKVEVDCKVCS